MEIKKFAGIDIGTNGARLLIVDILENDGEEFVFLKNTMTRVPIRLGTDVFEKGSVGEENIEKLCSIMQGYKFLMKSQNVTHYRACATSAMRDAKNRQEIVDCVYEKTGVLIETISGDEEAEIISNIGFKAYIKEDKNYMGIDVGGGSTEISIYKKGKKIASNSFPLGGVRLLNNQNADDIFDQMKDWIKKNSKDINKMVAIGSGGNINKVQKDLDYKKGDEIPLSSLEKYLDQIQQYSLEDRMRKFEMSTYRADVIVKALPIYIKAMKMGDVDEIVVPKLGLVDGIVRGSKSNEISF